MNAKIENEKRELLSDIIQATRDVKSKFEGSKRVLNDKDKEVCRLLIIWESVLSFGMRTTLLNNVQELFNSSNNSSIFWNFALKSLSADEQKRFSNLKNVWTDRGRTKALIRNALNENCLERYILTWICADYIGEFYEIHSILRDEKSEILPKLASDLNNILFAIPIDVPELNVSASNKPTTTHMVEPIIDVHKVKPASSSSYQVRKVNQIDEFEETSTIKKKNESEEISKILPPFINSSSSSSSAIMTQDALITTESQSESHLTFTDLMSEDHDTASTSSSLSEVESVDKIKEATHENPDFENTIESMNKNLEYEKIIENQRDRIKELEHNILDLKLENTRLRNLLSNNSRVSTTANFQVSIPRAILQKSKTKNYYVYEINLRTINDNEQHNSWTVFKRYRDFYSLHKTLRKQYLQIKVLDFPPKKKIGNLDFEFVEDRRQRLQVYIRFVLQNIPELQVSTRQLLEAKCNFFKQ